VSAIYLYDDARARTFEPFALTRPVSELMAGAMIIRERWELATGMAAAGFIGARHLAQFDEEGAPHAVPADGEIAAGSVIASSRFVTALGTDLADATAEPDAPLAYYSAEQICAVRLSAAMRASDFADGKLDLESLAPKSRGGRRRLTGHWLENVWDPIDQLPAQLTADIRELASKLTLSTSGNATVLGSHGVYCEAGAHIEPFVVLDAVAGPILICKGATISSFTRIVGPCYIGENTIVVGDAIRSCSIGETCKVRGEISNSIMLGHSNKGHTGFVGHSYLGRWVNLGAVTTTSNLKNTYGSVQMWTPGGMRDTGSQFLGTLFGDHVKTGIGTMLTTGTVLGAGANVYGGHVGSKFVPPFAWGNGEPYGTFDLDKFLEVAERMMARRHVELSEGGKQHLAEAFYKSRGNTE
jgi:UDP-N-acetylglucosamine diphosphorylase / glucose-1-phosphate thymidylyltransferase / UDP-N-acetylgalactosamine diphosphorylase / glucosamine-1-phosphate N-acetyltransferase / galactosamine-1-phosphate N-acetyltransferase